MQDWGRLDGGEDKMSHGFVHGIAGLVHKLPKTVGEKKMMEIGMRRAFKSAPAANRDIDSYKHPLLASSRVMIGLMRYLDEQNTSVFKKGYARE